MLIVSAAVGLGKMVVEGGGSIDRFVLSRTPPHRVLSRRGAPQGARCTRSIPRAASARSPCRRSAGTCPPCPTSSWPALADAALKIERYMKSAQDIEWAEDEDGELVILQARPLRLRGRRGRGRPRSPGGRAAAPRPDGRPGDHRLPGHRLRPRGGGPGRREAERSAQGLRAGRPCLLRPTWPSWSPMPAP